MRIRLRDNLAASTLFVCLLSGLSSAFAQELATLQGMAPQETVCRDVDGFPASALTDGDLSTLWRTDREIAPCHFVFRFDEPIALAAVTLHNGVDDDGATPAARATIWASHQGFGRGYFRVAHQELNEDGATVLTFEEPILMRALKVAVENANPFSSNWLHASLAEIEIEAVAADTVTRWPMPPLEPLANGDPLTRTPATRCDELAAFPYNPDSYGFGREDDDIDVNEALTACRSDAAQNPQSMRLAFQLARVEALAEQSVQSVARLGSPLLQDHPPAMYLLAQALNNGTGITQDKTRSRALHEDAAEAGFLPSRMRLAMLDNDAYVDGLVSGEQQSLGAEEPLNTHLATLMDAGYLPAYGLYNDYILRTDSTGLLDFMPRLEELAEYNGGGALEQHLYNDQHRIPRARRRAHRWIYEHALRTAGPASLGNLTISYRYVFSDSAATIRTARAGAYSGNYWPVQNLANHWRQEEAQRLYAFAYRQALEGANTGDLGAMHEVAESLIDGRGVEEDREEGARWMRLAAASGSANSIHYLQQNSWAQTAGESDQ